MNYEAWEGVLLKNPTHFFITSTFFLPWSARASFFLMPLAFFVLAPISFYLWNLTLRELDNPNQSTPSN
jgi:hypothetical protein